MFAVTIGNARQPTTSTSTSRTIQISSVTGITSTESSVQCF